MRAYLVSGVAAVCALVGFSPTAKAVDLSDVYGCEFAQKVGDAFVSNPQDFLRGNLVGSDIHYDDDPAKDTFTFLGLGVGRSKSPTASVWGYPLSSGERHLLLEISDGEENVVATKIFNVGQSPIDALGVIGNREYRLRCTLR